MASYACLEVCINDIIKIDTNVIHIIICMHNYVTFEGVINLINKGYTRGYEGEDRYDQS